MLKFAGFLLIISTAWALPETQLSDLHSPARVMGLLQDTSVSSEAVKAVLSTSGVPALDALWNSREDIQTFRECDGDCGVISRFSGRTSDSPLVILTGFTGYRKMYLETIYDLLAAGYGPIYALDFRGQGEALGSTPALDRFVARQNRKAKRAFRAKLSTLSASGPARARILELPVGTGHIDDFTDYVQDVNFVMGLAAYENPGEKIVLHGHSSGGLALMLALGQKLEDAPWIAQTSRVFLETPLLRNVQIDEALPGFSPLAEVMGLVLPLFTGARKPVYPDRALPEFVDKALGNYHFDKNVISHSATRIRMTDGMRVWNGYETVGATWGWARAVINAHYDSINPSWRVKTFNKRFARMQSNLRDNGIALVAVTLNGDAFVNTPVVASILRRFAHAGVETYDCRFSDSRHGLYVEADRWRDPFMALWADQRVNLVRPSYGQGLLPCTSVPMAPKI